MRTESFQVLLKIPSNQKEIDRSNRIEVQNANNESEISRNKKEAVKLKEFKETK